MAANAAIPGVFPPVAIDGRYLVDGGVANNAPISHAIAAGADVGYVLPTGHACSLTRPPRGALAMALHSVTLLVQQRLVTDVERYRAACQLRVRPPLCPLSVSPLDFSRTSELITRSHDTAARWLERGGRQGDPSRLLAFHRHRPDGQVDDV